MKEQDTCGQRFTQTAQQTHRVWLLQPGRDPTEITPWPLVMATRAVWPPLFSKGQEVTNHVPLQRELTLEPGSSGAKAQGLPTPGGWSNFYGNAWHQVSLLKGFPAAAPQPHNPALCAEEAPTAPQHSPSACPGTLPPRWGQRTYVQLLPATKLPFMWVSCGCPVATVPPKQGPESPRDQIFPQSSDSIATGPARHQVSSLVPTQIMTWLHSQPAVLDEGQKSWLLGSTGEVSLWA